MAVVVLFLSFILTIVAANLAVEHIGMVPVLFGLVAPAGVYFAGVSFTIRDALQDRAGRLLVTLAILFGAALSFVLSEPKLAIASGVAFLFSEFTDFAVYTPLRDRHWTVAVLLSGLVGALIDSAIFLYLAFGSLEFFSGQVVGKFMAVAIMWFILWAVRVTREPQTA